MIKFDNKELEKLIYTSLTLPELEKIKKSLRKGNLGGFSIEIEEEIEEYTVSSSSFIYYNEEEKRDSDYELLLDFLNNR